MKNKKSIWLLLISLCSIQFSCKDIFKKSLTNANLKVNNPPDNFVAYTYSVVFLWDALEGAEGYHIQIARPNFDGIQQLVVDSVVAGTKFTFSLYPGNYQWRIRAENGNTRTEYITRNLVVDSNSNLNGQVFVVAAPSNNYLTNNPVVRFSWNMFPFADKYEYILLDSNSAIVHDKYTELLSLTDTLTEGKFSWKVRAFNTSNMTATLFSTPIVLTIDLTAPFPPSPQSPTNNAVVTNPVSLSWLHATDAFADSLIIASDSLFQNIQFNTYLINSTSNILSPLPINNTYYWKLRSVDAAGNWSFSSPVYKFNLH